MSPQGFSAGNDREDKHREDRHAHGRRKQRNGWLSSRLRAGRSRRPVPPQNRATERYHYGPFARSRRRRRRSHRAPETQCRPSGPSLHAALIAAKPAAPVSMASPELAASIPPSAHTGRPDASVQSWKRCTPNGATPGLLVVAKRGERTAASARSSTARRRPSRSCTERAIVGRKPTAAIASRHAGTEAARSGSCSQATGRDEIAALSSPGANWDAFRPSCRPDFTTDGATAVENAMKSDNEVAGRRSKTHQSGGSAA